MIFTVDKEYAGTRLDTYVASVSGVSRSTAAKLIECGNALLNSLPAQKKYSVKEGDIIDITVPEAEKYAVEAENIPLNTVYEDNDIIVIDKPSGMVVHPAPGNYTGTLVNALLYHCKDSLSGIGGVQRPGIVHRIDKDTSGLLVVAKNDAAHRALSDELGYHGIEREYHALVRGGFKDDRGTVDLPIARHPIDRKRMTVSKNDPSAREAVTHYEVEERFGQITHLKLRLETGRTHQIRVHMSYLGHALLGDEVYASSKTLFEKQHASLFDGQMLHAKRLTLTHPKTGERMTFESELPSNFKEALNILRKTYQ